MSRFKVRLGAVLVVVILAALFSSIIPASASNGGASKSSGYQVSQPQPVYGHANPGAGYGTHPAPPSTPIQPTAPSNPVSPVEVNSPVNQVGCSYLRVEWLTVFLQKLSLSGFQITIPLCVKTTTVVTKLPSGLTRTTITDYRVSLVTGSSGNYLSGFQHLRISNSDGDYSDSQMSLTWSLLNPGQPWVVTTNWEGGNSLPGGVFTYISFLQRGVGVPNGWFFSK